MNGFIEQGGDMILQIILIIVASSIFIAIFGLSQTEKQVVILNTEILRSKIEEVCTTGGSATIKKLNFPQQKPNTLLGTTDYLPRLAISGSGSVDPKYVLYYEAFPPGEAIGWEVYNGFDYRFIAPFEYPDLENKNSVIKGVDVSTFFSVMRDHAVKVEKEVGESKEKKAVIVNNILLTEHLNVLPTEEVVNENGNPAAQGNLGRPSEKDPNIFVFTDYNGLEKSEKSYIKYRPCAPNSLCLKTRSEVYSFDLGESCKKIKYIRLEYDATNVPIKQEVKEVSDNVVLKWSNKAVTGACKYIGKIPVIGKKPCGVAKLGVNLFRAKQVINNVRHDMQRLATSYKVSDFYVASPCGLEDIEIKYDDDCTDGGKKCEKLIKYPMYVYSINEPSVTNVGDHYTCVDSIEETDNVQGEDNVPCIKIKVKDLKNDFCFTKNPYGHGLDVKDLGINIVSDLAKVLIGDPYEAGIEAAIKYGALFAAGNLPVQDTTTYMPDTNSFALEPASIGEDALERVEEIVGNTLDLTWGWPN